MNPVTYPPEMTALEYLLADSTSPLGSMFLGMSEDEWMDEYFAVEIGLGNWLETAPLETLRSLTAEYERMTIHDVQTANLRLTNAHGRRGVPSLTDLRALAERIGEADLLNYCDSVESNSRPHPSP